VRILSFDTTNNCVSIALLEHDVLKAQRHFAQTGSERQESVTLLIPSIDELLDGVGWRKSDIDLIVVGVGPGSFTGIRIGVVTARTLAQALGLPLIGVSLFDCYAERFAPLHEFSPSVAIVLSGGRGHYFFAAYKNLEGAQEPLILPTHGTLDEMKSALADIDQWLVEGSIYAALSELSASKKPVEELLPIENVAANQAMIAARRVSLSKSRADKKVASSEVSVDNERDAKVGGAREALLEEFPYRLIEPLYLRGASVTLKGSDGKAAATT
jgi:tRNA threonylcarbamoyl adenosine modification protein YeaZ